MSLPVYRILIERVTAWEILARFRFIAHKIQSTGSDFKSNLDAGQSLERHINNLIHQVYVTNFVRRPSVKKSSYFRIPKSPNSVFVLVRVYNKSLLKDSADQCSWQPHHV